jgi:methionyl-tRNA formyltransferase
VPALRAFAASLYCRLVVTQPDRPAGRGQRLQPTPVKAAALELGLEVAAPERVRDVLPLLSALDADLFAVASYGKILPQALLDVPRGGALNVHPSLLPLYRGATPLQSQLRDGVTESGVTIILMDAGMDTGDIVLQERSPIAAGDTYGTLHDRFAQLGGDLLARACAQFADGTLVRVAQAGRAPAELVAATLTRPLGKADLAIDWSWSAERVVNHVRAFAPAPAARAHLAGEPVKLLEARVAAGDASGARPGTILGTEGAAALVASGEGTVALLRLVPPNRPALDGASFARAHAAA